jgi:flagellar motor switch protein FliN/FliY
MIETPAVEQAQGEDRLIAAWARAAEQVLGPLTQKTNQLRWARQPPGGSPDSLATLEWWEAQYEAAGEHCVWIGIAGPAAVEVNRLAQALAAAGTQEPEGSSIPAQQTLQSLCEAFAALLGAESGQAVRFAGLQRLEATPAPEVLYSTEVPLQTGPPAPMLVGFKTATNATLQQLIAPLASGQNAQPASAGDSGPLGLLLDLELPLSVRFGRVQMPIERILELRPGSVVELEGSQDEQVDLLVNGSVVARGEVVAVDGHYAIRILNILSRDCKIGAARPLSEIQGVQ